MPASLYEEPVNQMVILIKEAAQKEILPRWKNITAKQKGDKLGFKDIVTKADKKASDYILERIRIKFPGSYSEEQKFQDRFDYDLIWQIDPLDGTQEFCEGLKEGYACHAALLKKANNNTFFPVAGIIFLPSVDKIWFNNGSEKVVFVKNGKETNIELCSKKSVLGVIRQVDPSDKLKKFYENLANKLGLGLKVVPSGGAGASISDLLEGKINLIVMNYDYTKEWDIAMAEPIIRARGGFICDLSGKKFTYNRPDSLGEKEPYNLNGYIISIVFKKEEILPHIPSWLLEKRL